MPAIKTFTRGEVLVVEFLDSKIADHQRVEQISRELLAVVPYATHQKVVLSFCRVTFMTDSMITTLVLLKKECKKQSVILKFSDVAPNVMDVFKITKLFGDDDGPESLGSPVPNPTKPPKDSASIKRSSKSQDSEPNER